LTEALWELLQKYGWAEFISSVDQCKSRRLEIDKPTTKKKPRKFWSTGKNIGFGMKP